MIDSVKGAWASRLQNAFCENSQAIRALPVNSVQALIGILTLLDRYVNASATAQAWLSDPQARAAAPLGELAIVAKAAAAHGDKAAVAGILDQIEPPLLQQAQSNPLGWEQCKLMALAWQACGRLDKAREWAVRTYAAALDGLAPTDAQRGQRIDAVSSLFESVGLFGAGKGDPAIAAAIASMAKQGQLDASIGNPRTLAVPLGTPEARAAVQAELTDDHGSPRIAVAKIVAWAYQLAGQAQDWKDGMDRQLASASGEDRPAWLLCRAYAQTIDGDKEDPTRGREWLDQVVNMPSAPVPLRLMAVGENVRGFTLAEKYQEALAYLDEIAGQFADPPSAAGVSAIRQDVRNLRGIALRSKIAILHQAAQMAEATALKAQLEGDQETRDTWSRAVQGYTGQEQDLTKQLDP